MAQSLALSDLIAPYLLKGRDLNAFHAALSVLHVVDFTTAADAFGTSISGRAEFQGRLSIPGTNGELFTFVNNEDEPAFDPANARPVFDLEETHVDFELFVPRVASAVIAAAAAGLTGATATNTQAVLTDWDNVPGDAPPSDYPASSFVLDLLVNGPTCRVPGLVPATLTNEGLLRPDTTRKDVRLTLPRLRFRLSHDVNGDGRLHLDILSAAVEGMDDPTDLATVELVTMDPPHALFGKTGIGLAFRGGTLDLSASSTPPDVLARIGVGDDWKGLYLPELRLFVSGGGNGLAFDVGATDFLWGFAGSEGIFGDFEGGVFAEGGGELHVSARFFDAAGRAFGLTNRSATAADATVPPHTRMVVDIEGGRAPYTTEVRFDGNAPANGRVFAVDLTDAESTTITIQVRDTTSGNAQQRVLTITVRKGDPRTVVVTPGLAAGPPQPATVGPTGGGGPPIKVAGSADPPYVELTTDPPNPDTVWSIDGGAETSARASMYVLVEPNTNRQIQARLPAAASVAPGDAYFYFDHPTGPANGAEVPQLLGQVSEGDEVWSTLAVDRLPAHGRAPGGHRPLTEGTDTALYGSQIPAGSTLTITGQASYEGDNSQLRHNYYLARRRALAVRALLEQKYPGRFQYVIVPSDAEMKEPDGAGWEAVWQTHGTNAQRWWSASITVTPNPSRAEQVSQATVTRAAPTPGTPGQITIYDPPAPQPPSQPDWFRSARVKVRMLESRVIAVQLNGEFDIATTADRQLATTGQLPAGQSVDVQTLQGGQPLGPDNPADGIVAFMFLLQENEATGGSTVAFTVGADPADRDGLVIAGNIRGAPVAAPSFARDLLAAYVTFWPLLIGIQDRDLGAPVDAAIAGAQLAIPPVVAALPWFQADRVILWGAELISRWRPAGSEGNLFLDMQADWQVHIPNTNDWLVRLPADSPLSVRYKAIGLRLADFEDDGQPISPRYDFRPVFDSARGYTIDIAGNSGVQVKPPLDKIMRILGARLSRINPITLEVELGMGIDFGVVSFDTLGLRVYLDQARAPEITAIGAHVDVAGAFAGSGYLKVTETEIAGDIDLTLRPLNLRVSGQLAIADIPPAQGGPATGLYVGMDLVLPVGIPLANTGLGIFGFRALFGMHYRRTEINPAAAVPSLEWLKAAKGKPNKLVSEQGQRLWEPRVDNWAFGAGILIGTMEGGFLLNLDGTLLLELPGPELIIALNARFLSTPPGTDEVGASGGVLAVLEITPAHIAIGVFATYEFKRLIDVKVPAEAVFSTGDLSQWHFRLGSRKDIPSPGPALVNVLGIVRGTGYLMLEGDGIPPIQNLPEVKGFGVAVGAGASFVWGSIAAGLYLKVGGGFDAVVGFDPILLAGAFTIYGELRLFIVSVGADASLALSVRQTGPGIPPPVAVKVHGQACGHVDFFFFEISACVSISFGEEPDALAMPGLVKSVILKSHSPALVVGTGTDRPIDASLGDAAESAAGNLPVVPIDSIPVIVMTAPARSDGATFFGTAIPNAPTLPPPNGEVERSGQLYTYVLKSVVLERIDAAGAVLPDPLLGSATPPSRWWTPQGPTGDATTAQLALMTWDLDPVTKAIETSDTRTTTIHDRWGDVCSDAAAPAPVLWTFRLEPIGLSAVGWELAGIPWPDADGTRRSSAADSALTVHERWRTGIASVDAGRGVMPASVIGATVPCRHRSVPLATIIDTIRVGGRGVIGNKDADGHRPELHDPVLPYLIRSDSVLAQRIPESLYVKAQAAVQATPPRDSASVLTALARGDVVSRADLIGALSPLPSTVRDGPTCEAHGLQSPLFDDGTLVRFGDPGKSDAVAEAVEQAGVQHGDLDDVVRLDTGPFEELRLLLFVPAFANRRLAVRTLDKDGNELDVRYVTPADFVPPAVLPATWTQPSGPWAADVADVLAFLSSERRLGRWKPVFLELHGEDASAVDIGWDNAQPADARLLAPWYLGVIELLRTSEVIRHHWDDEQISHDRDVVTESLGPASTDNAYLQPSSLYRLTVSSTAFRKGDQAATDSTEQFHFRTDAVAPARLDPFVLMTSPAEGETHCFFDEHPSIVFATHDVDRLWAAYGQDLKIRIQAASGRHPVAPTPGAIAQLTVTGSLEAAGAEVLSPFEAALIAVIEGNCIPGMGDTTRQTTLTVDVPLEPFTDYLLDVVAVPTGTEPDQYTPFVYRRRFSTGTYGTLGAFAAALSGADVTHHAITANATATHLSPFAGQAPVGQALDDALRACGLDVDAAPRRTRLQVLWESSGPLPVPTALILDADAPLWRTRPYPTLVADADGLPGTKRWQLLERTWLALESAAGDPPVLAASPIAAPGGQRALMLLAPDARGKRIRLEGVRKPFPEAYLAIAEERRVVVDILLTKAPWED